MPRFVVLRHESPRGLHWDFMIETGPALSTWALAEEPASGRSIAAEALAEHRLAYLDYEGPVSGGRGAVARWDEGSCALERRGDTETIVALSGKRLSGRATLTRSPEEPDRWSFLFVAR